jgi:hypothetical protein
MGLATRHPKGHRAVEEAARRRLCTIPDLRMHPAAGFLGSASDSPLPPPPIAGREGLCHFHHRLQLGTMYVSGSEGIADCRRGCWLAITRDDLSEHRDD